MRAKRMNALLDEVLGGVAVVDEEPDQPHQPVRLLLEHREHEGVDVEGRDRCSDRPERSTPLRSPSITPPTGPTRQPPAAGDTQPRSSHYGRLGAW